MSSVWEMLALLRLCAVCTRSVNKEKLIYCWQWFKIYWNLIHTKIQFCSDCFEGKNCEVSCMSVIVLQMLKV